jgi:predicted DNA binding CopG/RHH family protein
MMKVKRKKLVKVEDERLFVVNVRFNSKELMAIKNEMDKAGYGRKSKFIRDYLFKQMKYK